MSAQPVHSRRLARACCGIAVMATLATSACAAGQRAQTAEVKTTLDGTQGSVGSIDLRGLAIEPPATPSFAPGMSVQVRLVVVNLGHSSDRLTAITSPAITSWGSYSSAAQAQAAQAPTPAAPAAGSSASSLPSALSSASSGPAGSSSSMPPSTAAPLPVPNRSVLIPVGGSTSWGVPDSKTVLVLSGLTQRLFPGGEIRLTFTFAKAGKVSLEVPVELATSPKYSTVPAGSQPSGEPTG